MPTILKRALIAWEMSKARKLRLGYLLKAMVLYLPGIVQEKLLALLGGVHKNEIRYWRDIYVSEANLNAQLTERLRQIQKNAENTQARVERLLKREALNRTGLDADKAMEVLTEQLKERSQRAIEDVWNDFIKGELWLP